jgi:uncharacterized protein YkwD
MEPANSRPPRVRRLRYFAAMRCALGAVWLLSAVAALLIAAPDGSARPTAAASRACAYQNTPVSKASPGELRASVVCLINHFRGQRGLPRLREQDHLDAAAQGHSDQMVAGDFFAHGNPGVRITAAGFDWGAYGEAISTGFPTARDTVAGWLASPPHCRILLSPLYEFIGIGVTARPVAGYSTLPGTWTADLALPLGWRAPSGNGGPANGCPY